MDSQSPAGLHLEAEVLTAEGSTRLLDRHGSLWELPTLPESITRALLLCDGTRSEAGLRADLPPQHRGVWSDLLDVLHAGGLLGPSLPEHPAPPRHITVLGSSPLAYQVALRLIERDVSLHLVDPLPPDPTVHGRSRHHSGADALRARLLRHDPDAGRPVATISSGGHWAELASSTSTDLVVVADPHVVSDRAVTDHLTSQAIPHLVVEAHRDHGRVGPLVVPGRTACVGCLDRHHRDVDPSWPTVVSILARRRARPRPVIQDWAAATVASWALSPVPADQLRVTTTELRLGQGPAQTHEWPTHPSCPCMARPRPLAGPS